MHRLLAWLFGLCPKCGSRTRAYTVTPPPPVSYYAPDSRAWKPRPVKRAVCDSCGWRSR